MATHSSIGVDNSMDSIVSPWGHSQTQLSYFHFHFTFQGLGLSAFIAGGSGSIPGQGIKINLVRKNCICIYKCTLYMGFPWWLNSKDSTGQCNRHGFDPWVGKIPWRTAWQPTPVILPGESPRTKEWWVTAHGVTESDMTERLSTALGSLNMLLKCLTWGIWPFRLR